MRLLALITLVTTLIIGGNSKEQIQGLWISKYGYLNPERENKIKLNSGVRKIFEISEDSLTIKSFYVFDKDDDNTHTFPYQVNNEHLILFEKNGVDTARYMPFACDSNELKTLFVPENYELFFERLVRYHQASNRMKLEKLISSSMFELKSDSLKINFNRDSMMIISDLDANFGVYHKRRGEEYRQKWMIDEYQGELFLNVDGLSGFLLHITEVTQHGFKGMLYSQENTTMEFEKVKTEVLFDIEKLEGKWIEYRDENVDPKRKSYEKEVLIIEDSIAYRYSKFVKQRIDTLLWQPNLEREFLLLKYLNASGDNKQWRIISLNEEQLILHRKTELISPVEDVIEVVTFEKLN